MREDELDLDAQEELEQNAIQTGSELPRSERPIDASPQSPLAVATFHRQQADIYSQIADLLRAAVADEVDRAILEISQYLVRRED